MSVKIQYFSAMDNFKNPEGEWQPTLRDKVIETQGLRAVEI